MSLPRKSRQAGFTLIEVIIASLLVSTVMAMLLAAFISANRWVSPEYNSAHYVARQQLERLSEQVRQDWWNVSATDPERRLNAAYNPPDRPAETITLDGVTYTRNYTVSNISANGRDYRKAAVAVQWD